jgi:hypothetical protein
MSCLVVACTFRHRPKPDPGVVCVRLCSSGRLAMISIAGLWAGEYASGGANPFEVSQSSQHMDVNMIMMMMLVYGDDPLSSYRGWMMMMMMILSPLVDVTLTDPPRLWCLACAVVRQLGGPRLSGAQQEATMPDRRGEMRG